jgi:ribonuclease D
MRPLLIKSSDEMDELVARLRDVNLIAVDTEFQRETTYYPQLALVQIATDSIVACVDPLVFDARPALQRILLDPGIIKIFHSCSQDLEVLFYYLGAIPAPIYDTQIANALLTEHHQIGYAALVENELHVQLDKSQTRTNWLQRPLTEKQLQYAGDDVFYLYQLEQKLDAQLQQKGRKSWFEEESSSLPTDEKSFQAATDSLWKRVKGATRLNRNQLAVVQSIALWRERLAQQEDKIRKRILADDTIIELALTPADSLDSLSRIIDRKHNINDEEKQHLLDVITAARQSPADQCPDNRFDALDAQQKTLLKKLQHQVNIKAEELGISNAILCSRKDLVKLILSTDEAEQAPLPCLTDSNGWRYQCIGRLLIDTVKNAK